jgi:arylsulfatase A-like enzyme
MRTTTTEFLNFAADHDDRPIFAYLCYMDANRAFYDQQLSHPSWTSRPPMEAGIAAYEQEIPRLDAELDQLLSALERRGRLENTIVVVTSDHGESFGEPTGDHDPRGHGTSLYPEQVRVPLMVLAPGRLPGGARPHRAVSLTDLAGFIVRLAGGDGTAFPAHDMLAGTGSAAGEELFLTLDYSRFSARSIVADPLQYIWHRSEAAVPEEIFDLEADPQARRNIGRAHPLLLSFRAAVHRTDPATRADTLP